MSAEEPDFDVIVVGAGPAGAVTAYLLAQQGHSVVLIERGEAPGAKNLSGGVLYGRVLDEVFPGFADTAPVERRITRHVTTFLTADSSVSIDYAGKPLAEPVNAVTVLRAKFDPWLAERAEEAGVFLMPGVRVDELLTEPGPGRRPPGGGRQGRRGRAARPRGGRRGRRQLLPGPQHRAATQAAGAPPGRRREGRGPPAPAGHRGPVRRVRRRGRGARDRRRLHAGDRRRRVPVHQRRVALAGRRAAAGRPDQEGPHRDRGVRALHLPPGAGALPARRRDPRVRLAPGRRGRPGDGRRGRTPAGSWWWARPRA